MGSLFLPCLHHRVIQSFLQLLYDTFSAFGMIVATPKIMRDPDTGLSKGFGFVSYETFEASDAAIEAMHNQFLMNRYRVSPPSSCWPFSFAHLINILCNAFVAVADNLTFGGPEYLKFWEKLDCHSASACSTVMQPRMFTL